MTNSKENQEDNKLSNLYWLLAGVALVWFLSILIIPLFYSDLTKRGVFGDSFGVINSLFSGLAFAGIIYTILLQRKELKLQRDELELTRDELKKSADAQVASQGELAKQSLNMKRTAELNALSTLINSLENRENTIQAYSKVTPKSEKVLDAVRKEKKEYINQVKDILSSKRSI